LFDEVKKETSINLDFVEFPFIADFLLGLLLNPEDEGDTLLALDLCGIHRYVPEHE
jgi:hypothetical protein